MGNCVPGTAMDPAYLPRNVLEDNPSRPVKGSTVLPRVLEQHVAGLPAVNRHMSRPRQQIRQHRLSPGPGAGSACGSPCRAKEEVDLFQ